MAQTAASARMSAARSKTGDPCRRRERAVTLAAFAIGRVILEAPPPPSCNGNYFESAVYLIRSFSELATFLAAVASMFRTARMTMNTFFCQTAMK